MMKRWDHEYLVDKNVLGQDPAKQMAVLARWMQALGASLKEAGFPMAPIHVTAPPMDPFYRVHAGPVFCKNPERQQAFVDAFQRRLDNEVFL